MHEYWGCENNTRMAEPTFVEEDTDKKERLLYWRCPVKFVPSSIHTFLQYYDHFQRYPTSMRYGPDELAPRWVQAVAIYETELADVRRST